jgi:glycosyltransferase involved in cell wall biosynthesis
MSRTDRPTISVLIITLNEERMLDDVLRSVTWADEIVVLDSGSTDGTEAIARRYTDRFHHHSYSGEGDQRRRSLELSTGDWILYVDGDEVVTPELRDSIIATLGDPGDSAGFRVQIHTRFLGKWFGRRGWRREWKVRLFRRDRGRFRPSAVHSGAIVEGPVGTLDGALQHHPYNDIGHLVAKMNSYSSRSVADDLATGQRSSASGAVVRGVARFLRDYLFGGDFLYGGAGLIRSTISGYYTFLKYAKLWEARQPKGDSARQDPIDSSTAHIP